MRREVKHVKSASSIKTVELTATEAGVLKAALINYILFLAYAKEMYQFWGRATPKDQTLETAYETLNKLTKIFPSTIANFSTYATEQQLGVLLDRALKERLTSNSLARLASSLKLDSIYEELPEVDL